MGRMGDGYGSECHLLRWMGRHRALFNQDVGRAIGMSGQPVEWLDFPFAPTKPWPDAEWKGLDFLRDRPEVQTAWRRYWPTGSGIMNWDAVGWAGQGPTRELLLVEAKAHIGEIKSNCGAKGPASVAKIVDAFSSTKKALGIEQGGDWMEGYYQFTNRLAVVNFLKGQAIPTRLLLMYFVGDLRNQARKSPGDRAEWQEAIRAQDDHVGLYPGHPFEGQIHTIFLPVAGPGSIPGF